MWVRGYPPDSVFVLRTEISDCLQCLPYNSYVVVLTLIAGYKYSIPALLKHNYYFEDFQVKPKSDHGFYWYWDEQLGPRWDKGSFINDIIALKDRGQWFCDNHTKALCSTVKAA